eukprot:TRINITY_DN21815_c0_g1_i1.p1 TRINITY_DN21815_c0_g1~~TRINITY_DN21815_c0_g1_i1.p1  ORF type:complete len:183 (-),score=45.68 TRINITY_DN21815_c0_g1_i1:64-612(-)
MGTRNCCSVESNALESKVSSPPVQAVPACSPASSAAAPELPGLRLLHAAAGAGDVETCRRLLQNNSAIKDELDERGGTALHALAAMQPEGGHEVCRVLLQGGVDEGVRDADGHLAVDVSKDPEVFKLLEIRQVNASLQTSFSPPAQAAQKNSFLKEFRKARAKLKAHPVQDEDVGPEVQSAL